MSEENSIPTVVEQFLDKKIDVPADKVARFFDSVIPELGKKGFAFWHFQFTPGRLVTGYPGGSYSEDRMLVNALGGFQFINIDEAIRTPSIAATDIANIGK